MTDSEGPSKFDAKLSNPKASLPGTTLSKNAGGPAAPTPYSYASGKRTDHKSHLPDLNTPAPVQVTPSQMAQAVPGQDAKKTFRGWAPPQKEWDKQEKHKGDKERIEVVDEWDEEGNLTRTTIKKTITPDWKWKTTKTTEIIPASEAVKYKK